MSQRSLGALHSLASSANSQTPQSSNSSSSPYPTTPLPSLSSLAHHHHPYHQHPTPAHPPPTFLPSYYPESRNNDLLPSYYHAKPVPPDLPAAASGSSSSSSALRDPHTRRGSIRALLDGVDLASPPRQPRHVAPPTYELSPQSYNRHLPEYARGAPPHPPPPDWWGQNGPGDSDMPVHPAESGGSPVEGRMLPPRVPLHRSYSGNNGRADGLAEGGGRLGGGGGGGGGNGRMEMDHPPQNMAYQDGVYGTDLLIEGVVTSGRVEGPATSSEEKVGSEEYARALAMYDHLLATTPYIRPAHAAINRSSTSTDVTYEALLTLASDGLHILQGIPPASPMATGGGQTNSEQQGGGVVAAGGGSSAQGRKKPVPKCLGCGTTETPEWRRGPMGPRTLCNACGLVHMKLQRKKRKLEEKAAAAAAAAGR